MYLCLQRESFRQAFPIAHNILRVKNKVRFFGGTLTTKYGGIYNEQKTLHYLQTSQVRISQILP